MGSLGVALPLHCLPQEAGVARGWGDYLTAGMASNLTNLMAIDAARRHTIGLTADGRVSVWGSSQYGIFDVPTDLTNAVAVTAGANSCAAVRADGRLVAWGGFSHLVPTDVTNAIAVSAGSHHSLALRSDGTVVAWGEDITQAGMLDVPTSLTNAVAVAAGDNLSVAITEDGNTVGWGKTYTGFDSAKAGLTNLVAMDLSHYGHGVALREDGTVVAFGRNESGQTSVPAGLTDVVAVSAGTEHSLALTRSGRIVSWGRNPSNLAEAPDSIGRAFAIAAGGTHSVALTHSVRVADYPEAVQIPAGNDLVITPTVESITTFSSSWAKGSVPLPSQTNVTLRITNVQARDAGQYVLTVSNEFGSDQSGAMQVYVNDAPPRWERAPTHQAALPGNPVDFEAEARGREPLMYQWSREGVDIPGATLPVLHFDAVTESDAGEYRLEVRNEHGSIQSDSLFLATTVPLIARRPSDRQTRPGWTETLAFEVVSPLPATFHWYRNGLLIEGAQEPSLPLEDLSEADAGEYTLEVRNDLGVTTDVPVKVTLLPDFKPWSEPGVVVAWGENWAGQLDVPAGLTNAVVVAAGKNHMLALTSDDALVTWGDPNTSELHDIPSEAVDVVDIAASDSQSAALRRDGTVVAWGAGGSQGVLTMSNIVALDVGRFGIFAVTREGTVAQHPYEEKIPPGLSNVIAVASARSHYALLSDGTVVSWGPSQREVQARVVPGMTDLAQLDADDWHYVGLKHDGTVTGSNEAPGLTDVVAVEQASAGTLAITREGRVYAWGPSSGSLQPPPGLKATRVSASLGPAAAITPFPFPLVQPESHTNYVGGALELSVVARSASALTYEWSHDGTPIAGETNAALRFPVLRSSDSGVYQAALRNSAGETLTEPAQLTVLGPPEVYVQPLDLALEAGDTAWLVAAVAATPPAQLQWTFNGQPILGATHEVLSMVNAQAPAAGVYSLKAINAYGTVWSRNAMLTIADGPPRILAFDDVLVGAGATAGLTPHVTGSDPRRFEWLFQGELIGETSEPILRLSNVQPDDAGEYTLRVSNAHGEASASARVETYAQPPGVQLAERFILAWEGDLLTLTPEIHGSAPLELQWFLDGQPLVGATNPALTFTAVLGEQRLELEARNSLGTARRGVATVLTRPRPVPGRLEAWGALGVPEDPGLIVSAALGDDHWLGLREDRTVVTGGDDASGQASPPWGLTDVIQVEACGAWSLALRTDGTVAAWGANRDGQTDLPAGLTNIVSIGAGLSHGVALRENGSVVCWGRSDTILVPEDATNLVAISAGTRHTLALRDDGTVLAWGSRFGLPYVPEGLSNVVAIAAGPELNIVVTSDDEVIYWGDTGSVERPADLPVPVHLNGLYREVLEISADFQLALWGGGRPPLPPASLQKASWADINHHAGLAITPQPFVEAVSPTRVAASEGEPVQLAVVASGTPTLAVRWRHEGELVAGASDWELELPSFTSEQAGTYVAEVYNSYASTLGPAFLIEPAVAPFIQQPPSALTVRLGTTAEFSVLAGGTEPLSYQWTLDGSVLRGATNRVLTLPVVTGLDQGEVRVIVKNEFGEAESAPVDLQTALQAVDAPALNSPTRAPDGLRIATRVEPGRLYRLQSSTDLRTWYDEGTVISDSGLIELRVESLDNPHSFYRLVTP